jgi:transposase
VSLRHDAHPDQVSDTKAAQAYLTTIAPSKKLLVDKGYDSSALREWLAVKGNNACHSTSQIQENRLDYSYDKAIYKQCNIIERPFGRMKNFRHIAIHFDSNAKKLPYCFLH